MSGDNSTPTQSSSKPTKPYPEFPLFPHATGRWAKKIRGRLVYFGPWCDPDGALTKYLEQKDALHAGRKPRNDSGDVTVKDVANAFLNAKKALVESGELSPRTWADYKQVCDLVVRQLGKTRLVADLGPDDFGALRRKMTKRWGFERISSKLIQYTRSLFKYAFEADMLKSPVRFGPDFKRPSKKTFRLHRAALGPKLFTANEIRRLMGAAGPALKAMILLGLNAGFGNGDCAALRLAAVNLETGWIDFPRPKTGIPRRTPLWPETVEALRNALESRHEPKNEADAGLFFITKYGFSWGKDTSTNPISQETAKLLKALQINGRKGLGFYTLRHVFRTVADEVKDRAATRFIMGHAEEDMDERYRETISDARLKAVVEHVRGWLFASNKGPSLE
jgi:integrase